MHRKSSWPTSRAQLDGRNSAGGGGAQEVGLADYLRVAAGWGGDAQEVRRADFPRGCWGATSSTGGRRARVHEGGGGAQEVGRADFPRGRCGATSSTGGRRARVHEGVADAQEVELADYLRVAAGWGGDAQEVRRADFSRGCWGATSSADGRRARVHEGVADAQEVGLGDYLCVVGGWGGDVQDVGWGEVGLGLGAGGGEEGWDGGQLYAGAAFGFASGPFGAVHGS
ncbi:hypothetical protein ACFVSN_24825 [Kitasatospora sp. NPDC057904]|uniref:hypothetical protein n=1 Tax=Kitasatospora sp. NPDC057904 TaxID=3346275 RepID=UPI0036DE0589